MLTLTLKSALSCPLELAGITPDVLMHKSVAQIMNTELYVGKEKQILADLFESTGDLADEVLQFVGDFSHAVELGAKMKAGKIRVEGHAGREVGSGMQGGEIEIVGNTGDGLGREMQGGCLRVTGSVGNSVGSARVGASRGMTGGTILVRGDAGEDVGTRMRGGLIAIRGNVGEGVGRDMLAGTIVIGGTCGGNPGCGMKRGTLCLAGKRSWQLLPTFDYACTSHAPVLGMIGRQLQSLGFENELWHANREWQQYNGDFLATGRGEVFLAG